jgi:ABC-type glutathione transport system ATPase component
MCAASTDDILLSAHLSVSYAGKAVLRDVEFEIRRGEVLGLVGQSGSGKSTLAMAILGLLDAKRSRVEGTINFQDCDLLRLGERGLRERRGRVLALVLQSPLSSLNPALKIRTQLKEAWRAHASGSSADCDRAIRAALESVSLPSSDAPRF